MNKNINLLALLALLTAVLCTTSWSKDPEYTIYTYRAAESNKDLRYEYDNDLLELALQKTISTDGPYKLQPSPVMNFSRAKSFVADNTLPNFFIKLTYQDDFDREKLAFVPFPVDLGIVGIRVCFVSPEAREKVARVKTLQELKEFTHGQGKGWSDTIILRHNGFKVIEISKYENLFTMVTKSRFDLFCRGANELYDELQAHSHMDSLLYDESFILSYPLPRFFYTNPQNKEALDRVERGIMIAFKDGSLKKLWEEKYRKSIDFARLDKRKRFQIENPFIKGIDFNYQDYFFLADDL